MSPGGLRARSARACHPPAAEQPAGSPGPDPSANPLSFFIDGTRASVVALSLSPPPRGRREAPGSVLGESNATCSRSRALERSFTTSATEADGGDEGLIQHQACGHLLLCAHFLCLPARHLDIVLCEVLVLHQLKRRPRGCRRCHGLVGN